MYSLTGKVAVITGGSRGLGKSIAEVLAQAGAQVIVTSRNQEALDKVAEGINRGGGSASAIASDMGSRASILSFFNTVEESVGLIDILVNNAGTTLTKRAFEVTEEEWDQILDVNLKGLFFASQAAAKQMKEKGGGKIVNIASVMGAVGDVSISPYVASKGGVVQLTKALALEWARYNISVNAVGPGYVKTDMNRDTLENNERAYKRIMNKIPLRRLGQEVEIAAAVRYLCSSEANYVTGQTLYVDGGWTAE
ncbi:SDR family NAD(P)-dependent oxidoreductase [Peribacillus glennii]|uniref:SDR family oxidoreductase n=1 Tax=Peribacillus glennii TaxID=2303991 RepID=A0A372LFC0_9BACI|nr:glucose 1-dehydrogenase [Peribacillus glennii]RFU65005.1 SDR family oxidoreductase [Peribacillus glennii]